MDKSIESLLSLSKYRIIKQLGEQEIFKENLNNYEHQKTIEDMRIQEDCMFMRYVK